MMNSRCFLLLCMAGFQVQFIAVLGAFGQGSDRVLLSDIQTLTLRYGQNTNSRRSSPVPQLQCVGGSANKKFVPQVVQCYNRGTDGNDVQWECKTDMDNAYRFGNVEVSCEGFDYADDLYVLKGSCGLEYTLELTKEGHQQHQHGHQYYDSHDDSHHYDKSQYSQSYKHDDSSIMGNLVMLAIVGVIIYAIYKTCLATPSVSDSSGAPPRTPGSNQGGYGSSAPGYGFRPEYMPDADSCSSGHTRSQTHTGPTGSSTSTGGGGFWTGAATGGLLGYMFGSRGNYNQRPGYTHHSSPWGGSSWGGSSSFRSGGSGFGGFSSSTSTGTRTASGFGGTKRR